jgi:DNA-binding transcriptional ArsR family regulator
MEQHLALRAFESLSSGVRLDVFRLLVKAGPQGMVAGEIGSALAVPPTNLSFHLKALALAQLVSVTQERRYQRYRANLALMQDLIGYLTAECCAGHPEECAELCEPLVTASSSKVDKTVA